MLVILVSSVIGMVFSTRGANVFVRVMFLLGATLAFFYIYEDVLNLVGINEEEFLAEGVDLTKRASGLSNAGSGIDITNYNFFEKLFAFLYRPLFFDSPGFLGVFVSVENLLYLALTFYFIFKGGFWFVLRGDFMTKATFFSFITVSIALAQISGNLGLAIRQKSQVMMLFLFVVVKLMEQKKLIRISKMKSKQKRFGRIPFHPKQASTL
jgi:hypothetical protein